MNKNELIEKAVEQLNGEWPKLIAPWENYLHYKTEVLMGIEWLFSAPEGCHLCTREEFNAAADRMRGKPDWKDVLSKHPEAQYLAQWPGDTGGGTGANVGLWISYDRMPKCEDGYLVDEEHQVFHHNKGTLLGDWRNTLEKRPEQKADPLNGYLFGVEYPTGGKAPNLPYDVLVVTQLKTQVGFSAPIRVDQRSNWDLVSKFKIVDERFYSEPEPDPDKPWFEAGELPKSGTKCLCYFDDGRECWHECVVIGSIDEEIKNGYVAASLIGKHERKLVWVNNFMPIKTDKEKAIEFALGKINNGMNRHAAPYIIEQLYDAGLLRLPNQK